MQQYVHSLASRLITALAFLLPIFFIPLPGFSSQFSRVALTALVVIAIALISSVRILRQRHFSSSWSTFLFALLALPVAYGLTTIFSPIHSASLLGYQLDGDTFGFILLASALALVTFAVLSRPRQILSVLLAILFAGWVVLIFQAVQILFGAPFSLPLLSDPSINLVGKWNDLGLFMSFIGGLSLLSLQTLSLSRIESWLLRLTLVAILVLLVIVNFSLAWILLGLVALVTFISVRLRRAPERGEGSPGMRGLTSVIVIGVSLFFIFAGSAVATPLQTQFKIQTLEVRPSPQATLGILTSVYGNNALFGSGPNTFSELWFLRRPADIVKTPFWSVDFASAFGYIPTALITGGILALAAWAFLFVLFLYTAGRALLTVPAGGDRSYFLIATTSVGSLFLLVAHFFYTPSPGLTLLMFLMLGLFLSSLRGTRFVHERDIVFSERPRLAFMSVLAIAFIGILSLFSLYAVGTLYASVVSYDKATDRLSANDADHALQDTLAAISLSPQDRYFRTLTTIYINRLDGIVQSGKSDAGTQENFRSTLSQAIESSSRAVLINQLSYDNLFNRAAVYADVAPLGIPGAYENAIVALGVAQGANPYTPEIDMRVAQLKAAKGDAKGARESAAAALAKKPDYTPAILLTAQLALNEGKLSEAISSVEAAAYLEPQNSFLLYQLGLLHLQQKDYATAAKSFEGALAITPDYANASFFLAESYVFLGRTDEALKRFEDLATKNPGTATLQDIITSITKGENPFTDKKETKLPPEKKVPAE